MKNPPIDRNRPNQGKPPMKQGLHPAAIPGQDSPMPAGFGLVPVGAVIAFAGRLAPDTEGQLDRIDHAIEAWGWMHCDGRMLPVADYPELFALLGHRHDEHHMDGCFGIPDYRGLFMPGAGDSATQSRSGGIALHYLIRFTARPRQGLGAQ